jgi:hypothetical protein
LIFYFIGVFNVKRCIIIIFQIKLLFFNGVKNLLGGGTLGSRSGLGGGLSGLSSLGSSLSGTLGSRSSLGGRSRAGSRRSLGCGLRGSLGGTASSRGGHLSPSACSALSRFADSGMFARGAFRVSVSSCSSHLYIYKTKKIFVKGLMENIYI